MYFGRHLVEWVVVAPERRGYNGGGAAGSPREYRVWRLVRLGFLVELGHPALQIRRFRILRWHVMEILGEGGGCRRLPREYGVRRVVGLRYRESIFFAGHDIVERVGWGQLFEKGVGKKAANGSPVAPGRAT